MPLNTAIISLLLIAGPAVDGVQGKTSEPFDARPEEYVNMTPAEDFGRAMVEACPEILNEKPPAEAHEDKVETNLERVEKLPSYLASFPSTDWFAFSPSPRNVFVSADNYPGPRRCRVILANNMNASSANLFLAGRLQSLGAKPVEVMRMDKKRNLYQSVLYRDMGDYFLAYLIESLPSAVNAGQGQQATATTVKMSREKISKFFRNID